MQKEYIKRNIYNIAKEFTYEKEKYYNSFIASISAYINNK